MVIVLTKYGIRIIVIFLICALLAPVLFVSAAENVSFYSDEAACGTNRLINVRIHAQGSKPLCAALFEIFFDASILEFRGAKAPNGSTVVSSAANGGRVKFSFLCAEGVSLSNEAVLFTVSFKTLAEGDASVSFTVSECVSTDATFLPIGSCSAGAVTVRSQTAAVQNRQQSSRLSGTASSEKTTSRTSIGSRGQTGSSVKQTSDSDAPASTEQKALDGKSINDVIQKDYDRVVPLILLCMSVFLTLVFTVFLVLKLKQRHTDKQNTQTESNNENL